LSESSVHSTSAGAQGHSFSSIAVRTHPRNGSSDADGIAAYVHNPSVRNGRTSLPGGSEITVGDASTGKSTLVHQETTSFFSQGGAAYVERGISEVSIEDKIYRVNESRCLVHFVDVHESH
jgi:hypothetical protein